ncbi:hypothetical protein [Streptomonospora arabica]|uniref:Helix-turn-helix domain-containing protein n=1 Tax=Streptomonospora arabica TaxID=412417 RepID=A0ABV9SSP5_9ACTN
MSTDEIEIEALDQPSFTQVGHWVAFRSDLSPTARHLYTVLAAFVNQGRRANGDTDVWPSLNLLAVTLGLSKGKSVTPYLDELIQARIVEKTTNTIGGMRSRNTYGIRFNPPPGERSTTSFVELLAPLKAIAGAAKAMNKAATETRDLIKERRALESSNRTGRPVVPDSGPRSPGSGGTYSRKGDRNKTQGELDEGSNSDERSSSSGAPAEPPAPAAEAPAAKKTKKTPEQIVQERTDATLKEARAVVRLVLAQAAADGTQVRVPYRWLEDRDHHVLEQDLASVRRSSRKPDAATCGLHSVLLERGGGCSSCYGDIKAGDLETVRAHLAEVGADARPDLAAVLGAPEPPAGGLYEQDPGAYWKKTNKAFRGGTRGRVMTQEEAAGLAELTNEEAINQVLFGESPKPAGTTSRRQQESDDLFDRAMERARQREAAMANEGTTP